MAGLMAKFDSLLGPLAPSKQAAASAPTPRKIAVFTATSHQGRSVCHSLIKDGLFLVTAITKFPHGEIAEEMRGMKIEVVKGDIADPSSYEQYLQGKDGAFVNADFMEIFEHLAPNLSTAIELEITQSKAAVDACHRAGIKHIVYSAMDDLPEGVEVPTAVSKGEVVKYIKSLGVPATFIYPSHPYSDIIYHDFLRKNPRGEGYTLAIPAPDDCMIPGYAVEQFGDWAKVAFKKPEKWKSRSMHACGEQISVGEMAEALRKLSKKPVDSLHLTKEEFYSEENRADIGPVMFAQLKACYEGHMARRADESEKVAPHQWRFKQWAGQSSEIKELLNF